MYTASDLRLGKFGGLVYMSLSYACTLYTCVPVLSSLEKTQRALNFSLVSSFSGIYSTVASYSVLHVFANIIIVLYTGLLKWASTNGTAAEDKLVHGGWVRAGVYYTVHEPWYIQSDTAMCTVKTLELF